MITSIPVLEDMNGYFNISVYESTSDGYFKRTGKRPLRGMTGLIAGVSSSIGTIECRPRTNQTVSWRSPTVLSFEEHRPKSVYRFFKERIKKHQYYIATAGDNPARTGTLQLHAIDFKRGVSPGVKKLFVNKFISAMHLRGYSKLTSK
jgi:hypothetical protein